MGLIIKDQTAELERLRAEIAHKDRIIKGSDVVMNCWRERLKTAGLPLDVDG
jgi:hypothetical protein